MTRPNDPPTPGARANDTPEHPKDLSAVLDELRAVRDDVRVRIHLGGMEVKETLSRLEDRLNGLEHEVANATDHALTKLHDATGELRQSFRALRDKLL